MKIDIDAELRNILSGWYVNESFSLDEAAFSIKKLFNYEESKPLIERKRAFKDELRPYIATFGEPMIVNFFEYWSESSLKGRLMRKEKQPSWQTKRRLDTWAENQKKFSIAGIMAKRVNS